MQINWIIFLGGKIEMAIQLQLQSETVIFSMVFVAPLGCELVKEPRCRYCTVLCCVKAGTPMFGQFYNLTRVSGLFPGRSFVAPEVKWLL